MRIKPFILVMLICAFAFVETAWAESYVPAVNIYVKSKDGVEKELSSDVSINAREDFFIIVESSATVKSTGKKKIFWSGYSICSCFFGRNI